jgi:deoxycytidine triphosphate deaminase
MILTGAEIRRQHTLGRIVIDPFDPACLNPNSYDFHLAPTLRVYTELPLDPRRENPTTALIIPPEGLVLEPQRLYLGHTCETLGSAHYVPSYAARSSIARLGLFINLSATLGDLGEIGQWPLHLLAVQPLRIYPAMQIGQMLWWKPTGASPLQSSSLVSTGIAGDEAVPSISEG